MIRLSNKTLHKFISANSFFQQDHLFKIYNPSIQHRYCSLTFTPQFQYHMSYMLDSKNNDYYVKIDARAFNMYKNSLFQSPVFNEKKFIALIIDCYRTKQSIQHFKQILDYGIKNIDLIVEPVTIASIGAQIYLYNFSDKQVSKKVAEKFFELIANQPKNSISQNNTNYTSYHAMKFLVFLQKSVGIPEFSNQCFELINFSAFKPLYICFTLEMFYEHNIQLYPCIQKVMKKFIQNPKIIPFNDLHHLKMSTKTVKDPQYIEFVKKVDSFYSLKFQTEKNLKSNNQSIMNEKNEKNHQKAMAEKTNTLKQKNDFNNQRVQKDHFNQFENNKNKFNWCQIYGKDLRRKYNKNVI